MVRVPFLFGQPRQLLGQAHERVPDVAVILLEKWIVLVHLKELKDLLQSAGTVFRPPLRRIHGFADGAQFDKEIVLPAETLLTFAVAGKPAIEPQAPEQSYRPEPTYREDANRRPEQDYRPAADARPEPDYRSDDRRPEQDYRSDENRRREDRDRNDYRVFFSDRQQDMIRAYFRSGDRRRDLPPGLATRNGDLPPGLERQLRRNGTLPPGLQRRVEPFPSDLDRRLEPLPGRYSRVILSDRALILRGDQIVDIMFIY